jgi:hypothetical protein
MMYRTSTSSLAALSRTLSVAAALVASVLLLGACDSAGPASEGSNVEVGFATRYAPSGSSSNAAAAKSDHDSLEISGSNGLLEVRDVRLIVSELELEGDADSAEFEADPSFLDLPLDTTDVETLTASQIPPGRYNEFEFEVEDVDLEDGDDDEEGLQALREEIMDEFPDWPEGASMVVVGTFTPEGGTPQDFTTYFEAEIEVEREMEQGFEVTGDGVPRQLTVKLDPTRWFSNSDGTVQDLSQFDYASTNELVEFEAEFEDGVSEIEVDDDEDDEDDSDD